MSLTSLLKDTATITRPTASADAVGGITKTFADAYTDIRGLLQPFIGMGGGRLAVEHDRRQIEATHRYYTDTQVAVEPGDILTCNSISYHVLFATDQAGQGRVYAIYLKRITE